MDKFSYFFHIFSCFNNIHHNLQNPASKVLVGRLYHDFPVSTHLLQCLLYWANSLNKIIQFNGVKIYAACTTHLNERQTPWLNEGSFQKRNHTWHLDCCSYFRSLDTVPSANLTVYWRSIRANPTCSRREKNATRTRIFIFLLCQDIQYYIVYLFFI